MSAGKLFRQAVANNKPLQIVGTTNAYHAIMAEKTGFKALYLSGSGVAAASHGLPDLGITDLHDVVEDARRITSASKLPLLVDIDTGFGSTFNIQRTIRELERAGVAGVHIEDQVTAKRCGHRPGKQIVPLEEMVDRIKSAVAARQDPDFVIMARTDAFANEQLDGALRRAEAYIAAGADMLFPEALTDISHYEAFTKTFPTTPILANLTEFGKTKLYTVAELTQVGVAIALYPLSAFRAASAAALQVYRAILHEGSQESTKPIMQTREELYKFLEYYKYEKQLDDLFGQSK